MLTNITSLTGNGLKDWLIQRVTSAYFAVFTATFFAYFLLHPHLNYVEWMHLIHKPWVQLYFVSALAAYVLHAWIGIWTVTTDYLHGTAVRLSVQMTVLFILLAQLMSGFMMVWGR